MWPDQVLNLGPPAHMSDGYQWSFAARQLIPYFFSYKTEFLSFQNNPKNLAPSYKTDLDLWYCLGKLKFFAIL